MQALQQAVGFFDWAYCERGAEAVLLLAWNERRRETEWLAPQQEATSYRNANGCVWAESVRYEFPNPLPEGLAIFGDCHSHCEMSAYSSAVDQQDEALFNGLHVVVGHIDREPPDWHVEVSVDGTRAAIDAKLVCEGYDSRDHRFPDEWRRRHTVRYTGHEPRVGREPATHSGGAWPADPYETKTALPQRNDDDHRRPGNDDEFN